MVSRAKSEFALRLDEIQSLLDRDLKGLGFKRFNRTYNRSDEEGVVQVINFQMGPYEPPLPYVSPVPSTLKPDLYGKFAINIGVYVAEIEEARFPQKDTRFIIEPRCALRVRLGRLINPSGKEYWWRLDALPETVADDIREPLLSSGMTFLSRFATRLAIVAEWIDFNEREMKLTQRSRVDVAIILAASGNRNRAIELLREHLALPALNPHHPEFVRNLATKLGLGALN